MKCSCFFSPRFPRIVLPLFALALLLSPMSLNAGEEKEAKEKTIKLAKINVAGAFHDSLPAESPFGPKTFHFRELLNTIRKAMNDDEVAGLLLNVNSPSLGFAKVGELRNVLSEFKDSGKKIYAYTEGASLKDMQVLSMADFLALPESGGVIMPGFNIEVMYYKGFFEKIGFKMLVEHVGDFKSAYENFHLDGMSDANRKVLNCILDEFYSLTTTMIAEGRGISKETVGMGIDRAILTVKEAKGLGLIDAVMYRDQFDAYVKKELKADKLKILKKYGKDSLDLDTTNPLVLMTQIMAVFRKKDKEKTDNPKIAVIYASGPISSGKNSMDPFSSSPTIGSDTTVKAINAAANDDTVKAIVLRVDSPGGSGLASDMIWRAECEAKKKKPLIVSMADVAASGGYYIAMTADVILAEPGTITGSIGVVSAVPNFHGTLEKLGIKVENITRGQNANFLSGTADPDKVNLGILADYMSKFYWDFVDKVAAGRGMTRHQVHELAQGRVWTGNQALANGLVDGLGGLEDAIEVARIKAGLTEDDKWEIVESPEAPDFFAAIMDGDIRVRTMLTSAFGLDDAAGMLLLDTVPELRQALGNLFSFIKVAREETCLYMMPMEIMVK
jgi:protease IV